ncbi:MAG: hypothetical protein CHACPFDD_03882 [Phycisphaerae bacterium]|nr:hypothetical protein [Phycisphaerae bacterium]
MTWILAVAAVLGGGNGAGVVPGGGGAAVEPAAAVEMYFVTFEAGFDRSKLPMDIEQIAREMPEHFPTGPSGRRRTDGLARQVAIDKFEIRERDFRLAYANGRLETTPAGGDAPWKVLTSPRIIVLVGQQACVSVGRPVPYLEKRDDGSLILRYANETPEGATVNVKVERGDEASVRFSEIRLRVTRVTSREAIADVPLDVGRPIMDARETTLGLTLERGQAAIIPLPQNEQDPPIFVLLTARYLEHGGG